LEPRAVQVSLDIACDVDSPLLGEHGAARLFGPQKGATPGDVERLEAGLAHFASVIARDCSRDITAVAAGGAAGGIAAGLYGLLGARLLPGIDLVLDLLDFEQALSGAQLCLTGEGLLDRQSLRNKGPIGVARRARARGVPTIALVGGIAQGVTAADFPELSGVRSIRPPLMPLEQAMREAAALLEETAENVVRAFHAALH
ncbi:MAG TPA: glycerate kinase, partial [Polyangiaceae bacterium]|nr:glycerate kinase [Polyangiaceae bacterium]